MHNRRNFFECETSDRKLPDFYIVAIAFFVAGLLAQRPTLEKILDGGS